MGVDFNYMLELLPILLKYLGTTMEMATWGLVFSLILSVILANIRVFKLPVLDQLSQLYISFFRGTPLLVQLFLLYYGLPQIFPLMVGIDAFSAAVIGLTLHFAAYMAESIRAAIIGIDRSQMEASLSVGMTTSQAMRRVILPQATRVALPSLMKGVSSSMEPIPVPAFDILSSTSNWSSINRALSTLISSESRAFARLSKRIT